MSTLLGLFDERRSDLRQRLEETHGLEAVATLVRDELEVIRSRRIAELTVPQARTLSAMLALLSDSVGLILAVSEPTLWYQAGQQPPKTDRESQPAGALPGLLEASLSRRPLWRLFRGLSAGPTVPESDRRTVLSVGWLRLLQGVVCLGLLVGLSACTFVSWTAWPAGALVVVLVVLELLIYTRRHGSDQAAGATAEPRIEVGVDSDVLLDRLAEALDRIDRTGPEFDGPTTPTRSGDPIETLPDLLEAIQDLLAESMRDDGELTLRRCQALPTVLGRYGIRVEAYDPEKDELFDTEPTLDPHAVDARTLKPAFVRAGRALLRGRAALPAGQTS